jgi:hypothetical protein
VAADVVAIEARKAGTGLGRPAPTPSPRRSAAAVVTLQARQQAGLPADARPAPSVADYDQLLSHRHSTGSAS